MANVFAISDLHLGHSRILNPEFSRDYRMGNDLHEHDEWLIGNWNSVVRKKDDLVWVLGDVAFGAEALAKLSRMNGRKFLCRGNHDTQPLSEYLKHFEQVYGIVKRYGVWLSHAPVHPQELRGHCSVHGHVHAKTVPDARYINVCVEAVSGTPMHVDEIKRRAAISGIEPKAKRV